MALKKKALKAWQTDENFPVELQKLADPDQRRLLKTFAIRHNLSSACKITGISLSRVKRWQEDEQFMEAFNLCTEYNNLYFEQVAISRAIGKERAVLYRGSPVMFPADPTRPAGPDNPVTVAKEVVYDSALLALLLKGNVPKYKSVDQSTVISATQINQNGKQEPADWLRDLVNQRKD